MKNKPTDSLFQGTYLKLGQIIFVFTILLSACNNVKNSTVKNSLSLDSNIVISKIYGEYSKEIELFKDNEIKCTFSQVIDGSSCGANIFLHFIPQSKTESKITSISGQMKWKQNGQVVPSPFLICHIGATIYNNTDQISDDSFISYSLITEKFKNISGQNNMLLYNIEFCDSTYKPTPFNVDAIIVDLKIGVNSSGKIKEFDRTVTLDAITRRSSLPKGYRND